MRTARSRNELCPTTHAMTIRQRASTALATAGLAAAFVLTGATESRCDERSAPTTAPAIAAKDVAAQREAFRAAMTKGVEFLLGRQNKDGGFGEMRGQPFSSVGYTGLVVAALADSHAATAAKAKEVIDRAVAFMLGNVQPDGGIYMPASHIESYETFAAIVALAAVDKDKYKAEIKKGAAYLVSIQDDGAKDPLSTGGIGYGSNKAMSNLSTTSFALQALDIAGVPRDAAVWKNAIRFVSSCQNLAETNPLEWAAKNNDGGFIYSPIESKAPMPASRPGGRTGRPAVPDVRRDPKQSYASMTCAGLTSLLLAGVGENDVRVRAAVQWMADHYSLDENPGVGKEGLFYYYSGFATAMSVRGKATLKDKAGVEHPWAIELGSKLVSLQNADGSWLNSSDRWQENSPTLCTAYAVGAMAKVLAALPEKRGR